jgi:hypothetical protein
MTLVAPVSPNTAKLEATTELSWARLKIASKLRVTADAEVADKTVIVAASATAARNFDIKCPLRENARVM